MQYDIEAVEDAIVTALDTLKDSLGVKNIKTYQGELGEDAATVISKFPAVYVAYIRSSFEHSGRRTTETLEFDLFLADTGYKNSSQAERGSNAKHPGTYALVKGVRTALSEASMPKMLSPVNVTAVDSLAYASGVSVYAVRLTVSQDYTE